MNEKRILTAAVEQHSAMMLEAERYLFVCPETGFKEWKSSAYMAAKFEQMGYTLTLAGDIPGFTALLDTGRPGPRICIIGELDSLIVPDHPSADKETGAAHACGHHAQCAALLGVTAAMKGPHALDEMCGSILFACVPAEELIEMEYRKTLCQQGTIRYFSGKVEFMRRGLLDGVDIACMVHNADLEAFQFAIGPGNNGCIVKSIVYTGVATHAGYSPQKGVNALYAAQLGFQ
ncbi:amidohydrolase, partial [Ruminococcaceae bacterium OttesenSCG-928-A11]|nr:amidohydrolase [Ruminococcaceae bacterium OttesenSCG-928-A11]